ncbi:hypothetical protein QTP88_022287 [Uroleucon formosanum]
MGNPTKRALSSTSSNSPTYVDKKNKVFVTPNRFEVLEMEEQNNVFVQTESQLASQTTKTSPEPTGLMQGIGKGKESDRQEYLTKHTQGVYDGI